MPELFLPDEDVPALEEAYSAADADGIRTLKSEKADAALRFLSSTVIDAEEIARCRETVRREEAAYQEQVAALLRRFFGD